MVRKRKEGKGKEKITALKGIVKPKEVEGERRRSGGGWRWRLEVELKWVVEYGGEGKGGEGGGEGRGGASIVADRTTLDYFSLVDVG